MRDKKWLKVSICLITVLFALYGLITITRPNFLFEKRVRKGKTLVMKYDVGQVVSEYGISIGASKMFADGKLGFTNEFSGLCYVGTVKNGVTEYHWGHTLTIDGKWEKGETTYVTLK